MSAWAGRTLLIATHNAGKLEEMRALFAPLGITVTGAAEHGLPEPAEMSSLRSASSSVTSTSST